jgi:hypothetical protein
MLCSSAAFGLTGTGFDGKSVIAMREPRLGFTLPSVSEWALSRASVLSACGELPRLTAWGNLGVVGEGVLKVGVVDEELLKIFSLVLTSA